MSLEKINYENGLTTYVDHIPNSLTTSVHAFVPYGSVNEKPGQEGVAHALEHAVFLKTPLFDSKADNSLHARLNGMYKNANTYYTRTIYVTEGMSPDAAFRHLGQVLQYAEIPDENVVHEMKAVRREAMTGLDSIDRTHAVASNYAIFGLPYGRSVIGYHDRLDFDGELLRQAYRRHYRLGNMAIVATGAITPEQTDVLVRNYFDIDKPGRSKPVKHPTAPTVPDSRVSGSVREESSNVRLAVSYPLSEIMRSNITEWPIVYSIARAVMSDEYFQQLRYKKGISYNGSVSFSQYNHPNAWTICADVTTDTEHVDTANKVLADLLAKNGSQYESDQIKAAIAMGKYSVASTMENIDGRANMHTGKLQKYLEPSDISEIVQNMNNIEPTDVIRAIDDIIDMTATQPRFEHRTTKSVNLKNVDEIVDPSLIM